MMRHFKLYQILAPRMAHRGRVFGTQLALKDDWEAVDDSFFAAPGQWLGHLFNRATLLSCSSHFCLSPILTFSPCCNPLTFSL